LWRRVFQPGGPEGLQQAPDVTRSASVRPPAFTEERPCFAEASQDLLDRPAAGASDLGTATGAMRIKIESVLRFQAL